MGPNPSDHGQYEVYANAKWVYPASIDIMLRRLPRGASIT